jgi:hypothetical protein
VAKKLRGSFAIKIHFLQIFTKKKPQNTIKTYINHPTTKKYSKITQKTKKINQIKKPKPNQVYFPALCLEEKTTSIKRISRRETHRYKDFFFCGYIMVK